MFGSDPFALLTIREFATAKSENFDSLEIFQVKKASKHENPALFRKKCLSHTFSDIIALKKFTSPGAS
jgi:hypothetical protein